MSVEYKNLVKNYYSKLYSPALSEAMDEYLADNYTEHQYTTGFTQQGLYNYVQSRLAENPNHQLIIHKVIGQGDLVFLFVEEKLEANVDVARAELFRIENGKIAEHWGSHVIDEKNRKNSNGTFDGPLPNTDVDYGHKIVDQFLALDVRAFDGQEIECFYETRTLDYKQHSPKGADGLEGLVNILSKAKEGGLKVIMRPSKAIVEGDFIVCHRLYDSEPKHPLMNRINTFDLFRFNAEGKAVEHWDVMEDVPTQEMLEKVF
jgi:predicted SnoaL-like aldol condensation-catalyzing enzyme